MLSSLQFQRIQPPLCITAPKGLLWFLGRDTCLPCLDFHRGIFLAKGVDNAGVHSNNIKEIQKVKDASASQKANVKYHCTLLYFPNILYHSPFYWVLLFWKLKAFLCHKNATNVGGGIMKGQYAEASDTTLLPSSEQTETLLILIFIKSASFSHFSFRFTCTPHQALLWTETVAS